MHVYKLIGGVGFALLLMLSACWHSEDSGSESKTETAANTVAIEGFEPADGTRHVSVFSEFRIRLVSEISPEALKALRISLQEFDCDTEWECIEFYFDHSVSRVFSCTFCHERRGSTWLTDASMNDAFYEVYLPDVPGQVSYDAASRVISFKPARPLSHGATYRLVVDGLVDVNMIALPAQTISVETVRSLPLTQASSATGSVYQQSAWNYDEARQLIRYTFDSSSWSESFGYEYDDQGRISRQVSIGPGLDGEWGTDDDTEGFYYSVLRSSSGAIERVQEFQGVGADTIWNTADDELWSYIASPVDESGNVLYRADVSNAGPDAIWFTADDIASAPYFAFRYETAQPIRKMIPFFGAGSDKLWLTADDVPGTYWSDATDAQNRIELSVGWTAGVDNVFLTDDDTAAQYRKVRVEQVAEGVHVISYRATAGADASLFTEDDVLTKYISRTYDASGKRRQVVWVSNPGPDAKWFTEDDVRSSVTTFDYETSGLLSGVVERSGAGPDQLWNTDDDSIYRRHVYRYDADGNLVQSLDFDSPGADGVWFTEDDRVWREATYLADR